MTTAKPAKSAGIDIRNVNLSYGTNHVLKDVNLSIAAGEFFAFLGPSGCGKTTLLRLIAGFNQSSSGEVLLGNEDIARLPPWKRDVGMVFQSYALWPHMTVARNVAFGLEERRLPRAVIAEKVKAALDLVGLEHLASRYPSQLSGGQQQRVAVARTIAIEPKVLLLDEPLSNLDAKMRVQVRRELRDLQQRLGLTTVFVTHDQEEANSICDRIAVMNDGIIQQVGTPMGLYERPANLFVANFLGTANILDGVVSGSGSNRAFEVAGGGRVEIPAAADVPTCAKLVFRPQHMRFTASGEPGLSGQILNREFLGANVRYGVRLGTSEVVVESAFESAEQLRAVGDHVTMTIAPERATFLSD
jgi:iron(III) transport system ATP-binding protein